NLLSYTTSFLTGILETVVLLYFMLASGDRFRLKLLKVLPSHHDKMQAMEIGQDLEQKISKYLFTIAVINSSLGIVVGFVMFVLGMPNPALWGVLAGLMNFMPYIGPIIASGILTLVALFVFDSAGNVFLVPLTYLAIHGVESN